MPGIHFFFVLIVSIYVGVSLRVGLTPQKKE